MRQIAGLIITIGIVLATISAPRRRPSPKSQLHSTTTNEQPIEFLHENIQYVAGIALLSAALFLSAWLGIFQEETYKRYGKQWREGLFYCVRPGIRIIAVM